MSLSELLNAMRAAGVVPQSEANDEYRDRLRSGASGKDVTLPPSSVKPIAVDVPVDMPQMIPVDVKIPPRYRGEGPLGALRNLEENSDRVALRGLRAQLPVAEGMREALTDEFKRRSLINAATERAQPYVAHLAKFLDADKYRDPHADPWNGSAK